ncbi:MAG: hypothetical protein K2X66_15825 [Cyanobacteria bacterium]|nr:hypothetical protein [Cyanobacteriota bacterium]
MTNLSSNLPDPNRGLIKPQPSFSNAPVLPTVDDAAIQKFTEYFQASAAPTALSVNNIPASAFKAYVNLQPPTSEIAQDVKSSPIVPNSSQNLGITNYTLSQDIDSQSIPLALPPTPSVSTQTVQPLPQTPQVLPTPSTSFQPTVAVTEPPAPGPVPEPPRPVIAKIKDTAITTIKDILDNKELVGLINDLLSLLEEPNMIPALQQKIKDLFKDNPQASEIANMLLLEVIKMASSKWSPQEKADLDLVLKTLGELSGQDNLFNYGDIAAIVCALLSDTPGILNKVYQEIDKKLPGLGNRLAKKIVTNSIVGKPSLLNPDREAIIGRRIRARIRDKVYDQAQQQMQQQLQQSLQQMQVDPSTSSSIDGKFRNLTIAQMEAFQAALQRLQDKFKGKGISLGKDAQQTILGELLKRLELSKPPLRNGIPNPNDFKTILNTLLDALKTVRVKQPSTIIVK